MIDTAALLSLLRERDVKLWIDEDRLKLSAPPGVLDAELRTTLLGRKEEILAFLRKAEAVKNRSAAIVPIKPDGRRPPLFVVSGYGADVFYFIELARQLDADQPLLGVQPPGLDGTAPPLETVEALARYQVDQIRHYQANGPYLIAGHCSGGAVAFEVAQQLTAAGQKVALVALIGSPFPTSFRRGPLTLLRLGRHARGLFSGSLKERRDYVLSRMRDRRADKMAGDPAARAARTRVESATLAAVRSYRPRHYPGQIDLVVTQYWGSNNWHNSRQWRNFAEFTREHSLDEFELDDVLLGAHVSALAALLNGRLRCELRPELTGSCQVREGKSGYSPSSDPA